MFTSLRGLWTRLLQKKSLGYVATLVFFLFLSRGLGLVRNILLVSENFLTLREADIVLLATKVPDTLVSLLIMGTISSSLLPVAARTNQGDPTNQKVSDYLNLMYLSLLGVLGFFSVFILLFTPAILRLTTSPTLLTAIEVEGFFERYVHMTRILMLGPLIFATQGVFGIYLTLKERFGVYSWSGAIYNLGMIGGILFVGVFPGAVFAPVWGMMAGAALASGVYVLASIRAGYRPLRLDFLKKGKILWERTKRDFYLTWRAFLPRIFLLNGVVVGNLLINTVGDGWEGQVTAVDLALSIQGVFFTLITAVSTVFFPNIAKTFNNPQASKRYFWRRFFKFFEGVGLVSVGGTLGTWLLAPVVVWVFTLFGNSTRLPDYVILLTRLSAVAIVFQSLVEILSKYIYVRERVWQPALISLTGLVGQVGITFLLRFVYGVDAGVAVVLGIIVNFALVWAYMTVVVLGECEKDLLT